MVSTPAAAAAATLAVMHRRTAATWLTNNNSWAYINTAKRSDGPPLVACRYMVSWAAPHIIHIVDRLGLTISFVGRKGDVCNCLLQTWSYSNGTLKSAGWPTGAIVLKVKWGMLVKGGPLKMLIIQPVNDRTRSRDFSCRLLAGVMLGQVELLTDSCSYFSRRNYGKWNLIQYGTLW